jgi:hypothetical protein
MLGKIIKAVFLIICILQISACTIVKSGKKFDDFYTGHYYQGDGLGVNISIWLNPDGTYKSVWDGCMGNYGNSQGTWRANAEMILFSPIEENGMMEDELKPMKIVEYKGKKGFVPISDLDNHNQNIKEFGESYYVYTLLKR